MTDQPVRLDDLIAHVIEGHPGDPLDQLSGAVETSSHLGDIADHLVGHFVDQARHGGASWTEIGQHMGVSKQAVQKRFVPKDSEDLDFPTGRSLRRFTGRARNVIQIAREQARERGHEVTSEHLLVGLLGEPDGLAARAIVALGVPLEPARNAALAVLVPAKRASARRTGMSRGAKKSIELSLRESLQLGHNYIGTEHILLGILRNERELAAALLIGFGVTHDRAEGWVRSELAAMGAAKVTRGA
jgi:hypothetical protein